MSEDAIGNSPDPGGSGCSSRRRAPSWCARAVFAGQFGGFPEDDLMGRAKAQHAEHRCLIQIENRSQSPRIENRSQSTRIENGSNSESKRTDTFAHDAHRLHTCAVKSQLDMKSENNTVFDTCTAIRLTEPKIGAVQPGHMGDRSSPRAPARTGGSVLARAPPRARRRARAHHRGMQRT